jgi:Skp family chaperone for outer membrane proteins
MTGIGRLVFSALILLLLVSANARAADATSSAKPTSPPAAALPSPVVAVVDVQRILQESLAAQSVQKQLEAQRSKFQTEISAEESELRQAEQDLTKMRGNVGADIYAEKEQQLRQRFSTVERHVQSRRKALDQASTDSMNTVRKSLLEAVGVVAHEHGANLVIVKQQVLWSDKAMDITDEVLVRLNKTIPQVQVKVVPDDEENGGKKPK